MAPRIKIKTTKSLPKPSIPPAFSTGDDNIDVDLLATAYQLNEKSTIENMERLLMECEEDVTKHLKSSKKKAKQKSKKKQSLEETIGKHRRKQIIKELLEAIIEWGPRQAVLVLYMRWAKKVKNHFHSDSMAVLDCLVSRYPNAFPDFLQILKSKTLFYQPCTQRRFGGEFCNTMGFTTRFVNEDQSDEESEDEEEDESEDESSLESYDRNHASFSSSEDETTDEEASHFSAGEMETNQIDLNHSKGNQQLLEEAKQLGFTFPEEAETTNPIVGAKQFPSAFHVGKKFPSTAHLKPSVSKESKRSRNRINASKNTSNTSKNGSNENKVPRKKIPPKVQRFAMASLSDNIAYFEQMILKPTCSGKVGMRNAGISSQVRPFSRTKTYNTTPCDKNASISTEQPTATKEKNVLNIRKFFTQNLIEFHKPESFRDRLDRCITHRWLAYHLCRLLFKGRKFTDDDVFDFSVRLTQKCTYRHDLLTILAGVCLKWTSTSELDPKDLECYWNDPAKLADEAETIAMTQVSEEFTNREISTTICAQNQFGSHHFFGRGQRNKEEIKQRKLSLIRTKIFELWLTTDRQNFAALRRFVSLKVHLNHQNKDQDWFQSKLRQRKLGDDTLEEKNRSSAPVENKDDDDVDDKEEDTTLGDFLLSSLVNNRKKRLDGQFVQQSALIPAKRYKSSSNTSPFGGNNLIVPEQQKGHIDLKKLASSDDWNGLKFEIPSLTDLNGTCNSYLVLRRPDGSDVLLRMAPVEFYTANELFKIWHYRFAGPSESKPDKARPNLELIDNSKARHIDPSDLLHVIRPDDPVFQQFCNGSWVDSQPSVKDYIDLARAVILLGKRDQKRSQEQYRVNIGNIGQNYDGPGQPSKLVGKDFLETVMSDPRFTESNTKETLRFLSTLSWLLMDDSAKKAKGIPIGGDRYRKKEFSEHLRQHLGILLQDFDIENITLVCGVLHPNHDCCDGHLDVMNDDRAGYTRTGCFNINLRDPESGMILHLQLILNYRKSVGDHTQPFSTAVEACCQNIVHYLQNVQNDYILHFRKNGGTDLVPSPFDRTDFFVSDILKFKSVEIREATGDRPAKTKDALLTKIGPSRVMSLSMFIDPIVSLRDILNRTQLLELVFAACYLNNPFWFHEVVTNLGDRHRDVNDPFQFSQHPFFDWLDATMDMFDGQWQTSIYRRFSPAGGKEDNIIKVFGTKEDVQARAAGVLILEKVIGILSEYGDWIDSLCGRGLNPAIDLPLQMVKDKVNQFNARLPPCQFSQFRFSIFGTIASGCGLLKEGPHLLQLAYPSQGTASHKHLRKPFGNDTAPEKKGVRVEDQHQERAMQMIASKLGIPYQRSIIETLLCESHPDRIALNQQLKDWFFRGGRIFDLTVDGRVIVKNYGEEHAWMPLEPVSDTPVGVEVEEEEVWHHESDDGHHDMSASVSTGPPERSEVEPFWFEKHTGFVDNPKCHAGIQKLLSGGADNPNIGRRTRFRTMLEYTFSPPSAKQAKGLEYVDMSFVDGKVLSTLQNGDKVYVLEKGPSFLGRDSLLQIGEECLPMFDYFKRQGYPFDMVTVRRSPPTDQICVFDAHVDKPAFQNGVGFIPIATSFWTVLGVQAEDFAWDDRRDCMAWCKSLCHVDQTRISNFLQGFDGITKQIADEFVVGNQAVCNSLSAVSIWYCSPGSALNFLGGVKHGTIIPRSTVERQLLIFTEAVKV